LRSCLVPVVDDAGLHQIGDPVADRPRMAATLPVRPRTRARNEELELLQRRWKQSIGPRDRLITGQEDSHERNTSRPARVRRPTNDLGRLYFEEI
jgi:hypothetical protein